MSSDVTAAVISAVNAPPLGERGYALAPAEKAASMTAQAGPLIRILSDPALTSLVVGYQKDDQEAIDAQKHYRRWNWISMMARYGIIILGILALSFPQLLKSWLGSGVDALLGSALTLQLVLLFITLLIGLYTRATRPLEQWMRLRSYAEVKRLGFFEFVMQRPQVATGDELPVLPLKLEFFVRYLLEPQLDYFMRRAKQLGKGTGLNTVSLLMLSAVILYTLAQVVLSIAVQLFHFRPPVPFDPELAMWRALVGAAFAVLLAATSLSRLDERNALRYLQTADNLKKLNDDYLPLARDAAVAGDEVAVSSFVRLVNEQVGFGAADWLSLDSLLAISKQTTPNRASIDVAAARRFLLALGMGKK